MNQPASSCRGWANLGEGCEIPDHVLLLDNVPHDWLLPQCSAVVHHGGAGTTAAGACFQLQPAADCFLFDQGLHLRFPCEVVVHLCLVASCVSPRQGLDLKHFKGPAADCTVLHQGQDTPGLVPAA